MAKDKAAKERARAAKKKAARRREDERRVKAKGVRELRRQILAEGSVEALATLLSTEEGGGRITPPEFYAQAEQKLSLLKLRLDAYVSSITRMVELQYGADDDLGFADFLLCAAFTFALYVDEHGDEVEMLPIPLYLVLEAEDALALARSDGREQDEAVSRPLWGVILSLSRDDGSALWAVICEGENDQHAAWLVGPKGWLPAVRCDVLLSFCRAWYHPRERGLEEEALWELMHLLGMECAEPLDTSTQIAQRLLTVVRDIQVPWNSRFLCMAACESYTRTLLEDDRSEVAEKNEQLMAANVALTLEVRALQEQLASQRAQGQRPAIESVGPVRQTEAIALRLAKVFQLRH